MRIAALTIAGAIGVVALGMSANAASVATTEQHKAKVVRTTEACVAGFHHNRLGRCIPDRVAHRARAGGGAYGDRQSLANDRMANELNRMELGRVQSGTGQPGGIQPGAMQPGAVQPGAGR